MNFVHNRHFEATSWRWWSRCLSFCRPTKGGSCRNLPFGGKAKQDRKVRLFMKKTHGVATNVYSRENIRKTKKRGLGILKIRVWELFRHGEGISTPHARHKGQQPLIECVQRDSRIIYFPFLYFIFFGVDKGAALAPMYPQVWWGIQTYVVL